MAKRDWFSSVAGCRVRRLLGAIAFAVLVASTAVGPQSASATFVGNPGCCTIVCTSGESSCIGLSAPRPAAFLRLLEIDEADGCRAACAFFCSACRSFTWRECTSNGGCELSQPGCVSCVSCVGDCDGDGSVFINELMVCVNIAMDRLGIDACAACDDNGNGRVEITDLIIGVHNSFLDFCGA